MLKKISPTLEMWTRAHQIEKLAKTPIRSITLLDLRKTVSNTPSALIRNAEWIREEMRIRFAHRLWDFNRLPHIVMLNPSIHKVYELYLETFKDFNECEPIKDSLQEEKFSSMIKKAITDHTSVVDTMRKGIREIRILCPELLSASNMDSFLERLFVTRISRRVILEHHLALHNKLDTNQYAGVVQLKCKPTEIIRNVFEEVSTIAKQIYGISPLLKLKGNLDIEFAFIPEHLQLIIYEILKNSIKATIEFHTLGNSLSSTPVVPEDLPPVVVEIYKGKNDIIIKISDQGGGILPHRLNSIWSYGYTTASETVNKFNYLEQSTGEGNELAGYGFGLPLSRAYAKYFGGDVHLQSMFGHGTDTFVNLNIVGDQPESLIDFDKPSHYAQN